MDNEKIKTPISVMLDMAKNEIGAHVCQCMEINHIEPPLMALVLKEILLDVIQLKTEQLSMEYVAAQKEKASEEVE